MDQPQIAYSDHLRICRQLNETGMACLENAVPADWLTEAQAGVRNLLATHGERDHFIVSPADAEHAAANAFITSPSVHRLLSDLVRAEFPDGTALPELTGSALRVIAGPRGEGEAYWFHYDASAVTMVVPLYLPDAGRGMSGELVGLFNKRPFRRLAIVNIIDKALGQSGPYRSRILRKLAKDDAVQRVDMKVGNLYLFWGYRSLHANMPCQSGAVRATLLLHFGRLHGSSRALSTAIRIQHQLRNLRPSPQRRMSGQTLTEPNSPRLP
jgi:hypothetical protein